MGTPPQTAPQEPLQVPNTQLPVAPGVAQQMEFTRAMLQAQDEQIRQQAAQLQQMSAMLTQALQLASANAANAHVAAATTSSWTSPAPGGDPSAASANASTPVDMEVDSGVRNKRAEGYIPQLPQLNYASMTSRHAEIRVWTAYRDELTSWLCLLDDRYATELQEAMSSSVEVSQVKLEAGKAAQPTKLWFLLRQSMSKFQRGQDLVHLIEVKQMGASAGYELWRSLNNELSVRSRVEGQALREQALGLVPPKHLKRPLDVARWYTTELLKFEAQVKHRFPELLIGEQEGVLCLMKHLDSETKRYLLLHHSTRSMSELMTGLQFYDEQLRVMDFQREGASGYANAFKGGKGGKGDRDKSNKGSKGNKGNKGEKGEKGQKGGKAKGKDRKGDRSGKGDRARSKSREAKKTDVCRNCGKTGHWARDCWAPSKDKAAAATSQAVTTQPEAPSSSSSTSAKAAAQPTTKGSGKAQSSIKTFLEGYHFGMMLTNQVVSFPSDDRIYWLIDSGSSFHIITRETLESDHVKILSWLEGRPKSYAETATGDSVEIGGSTHVLVEVCFETTTPASSKSSSEHESDAVYMCKARFEAVISDQIKHNLLNINLLCQNGGWEPTLCVQQGGITVRKHGVTLKPTLFASVSWLASVRSDHPLALKPQDLIGKTEQRRKNRSRKSSADRDFHRSTSNRGYRNSARVCVEPENPELLDISCLDEMSDCKGHVSHEHADLDQGETKEKLRAVDELLSAAPSSSDSVSHADMPVFHELDSHTCLFSCADDNIISHGEQNNNTTPAVEWLVHACDSSATAANFPLSCFGRDLQEQSPKYRPESLGCPKHQEPPSFVVDAFAHHGRAANGGGASHERDNGPLYQRAGGYARGSASAQDATRGRAPGEQNHRGRGATRSPTRRGDFSGHDLRSLTPAIRRGDDGRSRRCDNDGTTIIPSSQRAHDGGAAVLPQGHSHADAANSQDIEEERGPEEGEKTSTEEKKTSEEKSDSYEIKGNDPEAWRRFMEARAAKNAASKPKKKKPAKERKPMEERPVVQEPSGPPPDSPDRPGKASVALQVPTG